MRIFTIILILFLSAFVCISFLAYDKILKPAYYSTISDCTTNGENASIAAGYYTTGLTTINPKNSTDIKVQIINNSQSDIILRHEMCHVAQAQHGWIFHCSDNNGKVLRYLAEVEAYSAMYLKFKC
jgi:hypothetical protein